MDVHTQSPFQIRIKNISEFHVYCVAVGSGSLDHTGVIVFYANEVETLMMGKKYYCATRNQIITAKFGVLAELADCPKNAFILETSLLDTYGKIASWVSEIHIDILLDCNK